MQINVFMVQKGLVGIESHQRQSVQEGWWWGTSLQPASTALERKPSVSAQAPPLKYLKWIATLPFLSDHSRVLGQKSVPMLLKLLIKWVIFIFLAATPIISPPPILPVVSEDVFNLLVILVPNLFPQSRRELLHKNWSHWRFACVSSYLLRSLVVCRHENVYIPHAEKSLHSHREILYRSCLWRQHPWKAEENIQDISSFHLCKSVLVDGEVHLWPNLQWWLLCHNFSLVLSVPLLGWGVRQESDKEAVLGVFANCIHLGSFKTELVQYILEILSYKYTLETLK